MEPENEVNEEIEGMNEILNKLKSIQDSLDTFEFNNNIRVYDCEKELGELSNDLQAQIGLLYKLQHNRLKSAVHALLKKRNQTEWTHEDAYDFTFKSCGRDEWNEVIKASGWTG